jgi:hypothetical protein
MRLPGVMIPTHANSMTHVHERLERLRAKLKETISVEAPGIPLRSLRATACMPYPEDDKDLVFFYGDGVAPHGDFDYATTRLSELLQGDGIETAFARVTSGAYVNHLAAGKIEDLPERRFAFLASACGCAHPPDTIVSGPLLSPAVLSLTIPGAAEAVQFLVV